MCKGLYISADRGYVTLQAAKNAESIEKEKESVMQASFGELFPKALNVLSVRVHRQYSPGK